MENLLRKEINNYDIIVNAVLWDVSRTDHIIYKDDLKRMKKGSLIIDISCDRHGAIETSIPTTIDNPTYIVDGVVHYAVDHTPSLVYKTVSFELSKESSKFIDELIEENYSDVLRNANIIKEGNILDDRINEYQKR
jgi:N5-(carboxyethyl)ornithine synthase